MSSTMRMTSRRETDSLPATLITDPAGTSADAARTFASTASST
jgi:hypothetical protein